MASLVATPLSLLIRRAKIVAPLLGALVLLINLAEILPWYRPSGRVRAEVGKLRVCLFNVYTPNKKHSEVVSWVRRTRPDILVLQEVNRRWIASLKSLGRELPHLIARPRSDNFGIAFLSRLSIVRSEVFELGGDGGLPAVLVRVRWNQREITVLGVHLLPPVGRTGFLSRNSQMEETAERIGRLDPHNPVLLLGDLNTTMWSLHYKQFESRTLLNSSRKGHGILATWPTMLPSFLRFPLDHILHSRQLVALKSWLGPDMGSDHLPICADLALTDR